MGVTLIGIAFLSEMIKNVLKLDYGDSITVNILKTTELSTLNG